MKLAEADSQTMRALKASLIDRGVAKQAGSTWGDFKEAVQALGFKDSDPLGSIEYGIKSYATGHILKQDDDILEL